MIEALVMMVCMTGSFPGHTGPVHMCLEYPIQLDKPATPKDVDENAKMFCMYARHGATLDGGKVSYCYLITDKTRWQK